ncbi:MAG: hypothetical protein ACAH80_06280 [Alphaproteobacteria bacterium]
MSRSHKHAAPKSKKRLYLMAGGVFVAACALFIAIDRQQLPAGVRSNPYVIGAYETRDAALEKGEALLGRKAAEVEPAAGNDDGAGYKREDRARLERLIREGAEDE